MAYTVKKLAKLSGVSVRTLHFYDETGLLKPDHYGENGYRYYEEEQLLLLQQILFFRELGLPLNEIQAVLGSKDFDKVKALESHKKILQQNADRTKQLIQTIDKTISRLKGELIMSDEEMYYGFDPKKQKEYEEYLVNQYGKTAQNLIQESQKRVKNWKKQDYDQHRQEMQVLHQSFTDALKSQLSPSSIEVQNLVAQHFKMIELFYTPTHEVYVGLGRLYIDHPDFRKLYDSFDPKLAEFMAEAMRVYADHKFA